MRVEIPDVAAAFAGLCVFLAARYLLGVVLAGVRVEMGAGEDDLLAVGPKERAGRLAEPGGDAPELAGGQVHGEDLVEGVARAFLLGLEDDASAIGREIAFAGANESVLAGDLVDVLQMRRLRLLPVRRLGGRGEQDSEREKGEHVRIPLLQSHS